MHDCYKWFELTNTKLVNHIPVGPAYILPDGRFADLNSSGYRTHGAHDAALLDIGYPVNLEDDELHYRFPVEFMGCVRVNDGKNFSFEVVVDLPVTKVTSDQLDSIERYFENLELRSIHSVMVGCEFKNTSQVYDLREVDTYSIRRKISGFYSLGVLHESDNSGIS